MKRYLFTVLTAFTCLAVLAVNGVSAQSNEAMPSNTRLTVFISDLHWGLGRDSNGNWIPTEDFRWSNALKAFLEAISKLGTDDVDLVIAGDFLELWQPPTSVKCTGTNSDFGCTVNEVKKIVTAVTLAHAEDFASLKKFSERGRNLLHIIPGNHDVALLIPEIWSQVSMVLGNRAHLVEAGIWRSPDGRLIAEHGHQIGGDVNKYDDNDWPGRMTELKDGAEYLKRSWGERFVQKLFNDEERQYPIIDNLIPETAGARYRMADRGLWKSANDLARFLAFNMFETSYAQKKSGLGRPAATAGDWKNISDEASAAVVRNKLGHRLFVESLARDDPFRIQIEGASAEAADVRKELDQLAAQLSLQDLNMLCMNLIIVNKSNLCDPSMGAVLESALIPRATVIKRHLSDRIQTFKNMKIFVYGHTHQLESQWQVKLNSAQEVSVFNTGAFQRLIGDQGFRQRASGLPNLEEGLTAIGLDQLPPCYSAVLVRNVGDVLRGETRVFYAPEAGPSKMLSPGSSECI